MFAISSDPFALKWLPEDYAVTLGRLSTRREFNSLRIPALRRRGNSPRRAVRLYMARHLWP